MIPAGTKIICPECGKVIAQAARPIERGMALDASLFIPIEGQIENGSRPICNMCNAAWIENGGIHTETGWAC